MNVIQKRIILNNFQTLRYVLFDEKNRLPWATHLYYDDNKFKVNSRDERSYVVGKTWEFDSLEKASDKFFNILTSTVESEKLANKLGFSHPYSSPLWDNIER